jgi:hypothetical protein
VATLDGLSSGELINVIMNDSEGNKVITNS